MVPIFHYVQRSGVKRLCIRGTQLAVNRCWLRATHDEFQAATHDESQGSYVVHTTAGVARSMVHLLQQHAWLAGSSPTHHRHAGNPDDSPAT